MDYPFKPIEVELYIELIAEIQTLVHELFKKSTKIARGNTEAGSTYEELTTSKSDSHLSEFSSSLPSEDPSQSDHDVTWNPVVDVAFKYGMGLLIQEIYSATVNLVALQQIHQ